MGLKRRSELAAALEAVLYASSEPVTVGRLVTASGSSEQDVRNALAELQQDYADVGSGLEIRFVGGGYQVATRPQYAEAVAKIVGRLRFNLSPAALETLALIAVSQPVTAPEIESVRKMNAAGVLETLLRKKLIVRTGRRNTPGRPVQYRTTKQFEVLFALSDFRALSAPRSAVLVSEASLNSRGLDGSSA